MHFKKLNATKYIRSWLPLVQYVDKIVINYSHLPSSLSKMRLGEGAVCRLEYNSEVVILICKLPANCPKNDSVVKMAKMFIS